MSGLPAGAEVPRTSFTVRSFSLLCENPEDSRSKESARRRAKGLALGRKKFWRGGRLPSAGSCTRKRAPIPLCGNAGGLMGGPPAAFGAQDKDDAQYVPWAPVASENKPVARGAGKPRAAQGPPGQTGSPGLALGPATRSRLPGRPASLGHPEARSRYRTGHRGGKRPRGRRGERVSAQAAGALSCPLSTRIFPSTVTVAAWRHPPDLVGSPARLRPTGTARTSDGFDS
jgi:hypothetical protein